MGTPDMLIFSAKTRQVIDYAIANFGDVQSRDVWSKWLASDPRVRSAGEPWHDGKPELPHDVVVAALNALDGMKRRKRDQREMPGLTEDQISELDNDLSLIRSAERFLTEWTAPLSQRNIEMR
jgi:hypothetical protein